MVIMSSANVKWKEINPNLGCAYINPAFSSYRSLLLHDESAAEIGVIDLS